MFLCFHVILNMKAQKRVCFHVFSVYFYPHYILMVRGRYSGAHIISYIKYRLYHEVEVYKRFIYRGPKARGE